MCYVLERSAVDVKNKIMTRKLTNMTLRGLLVVTEEIFYTEDKGVASGKDISSMKHTAEISVTGHWYNTYLEGLIAEGFIDNAEKGYQATRNAALRICDGADS